MKRNAQLAVLGGLTILVVCCLLILLFLDGYYLPNKPCRPITYPEGKRTSEGLSRIHAASLESILTFFDQHLDIRPAPVERGQWQREELSSSKYLYSCISVDINKLTGETGCIYVSKDGQATRVDSRLIRWEGGSITCPRE